MAMMAIAGPTTEGFTPDLAALLIQTQVGPLFTAYLKTELEIQDVMDLALLASDEAAFNVVMIEAKIADAPREKVKARKAWTMAREARDQRNVSAGPASGAAASAADDGPLAHGVVESLRDAFVLKHQFHLSGARLLSDSAFNSTYRGVHRTPMRLKIILLENVKAMSNLNTENDLTGVVLSSAGGISNVGITHSVVATAHDRWKRFRIVMVSICYIMMAHNKLSPL